MTVAVRIFLVVSLTVAACHRDPPRGPPPRPSRPSGPGATPRTRAELPTTSGEIALSNLDSQIQAVEALVARDGAARSQLIPLLLMRGQLRGRIADYERADRLAGELVAAAPRSVEALQLR